MKRQMILVIYLLALSLSFPSFCFADHGLALHGAPSYPKDFKTFAYANPEALKGGLLRMAAIGTYDNLNPYILKGVSAADASIVFETLMEPALDEPFSQYGRVALEVSVATDKSWVSYELNPKARFHDGSPITPEDVIFSYEILRDKGHPFYKSYYKDIKEAIKTGPLGVKFAFSMIDNTELPLIIGQMPIFSKSFWKGRDFSATTLDPIMGSGPYQIEKVDAGRSITYRHVQNWWGENLPVNKGRYNFDRIQYDYYRDANVALEALFAGKYDYRIENSAKNWATAYTSPAVKNGQIIKEIFPNELPAGMQGFVFNIRRDKFKDKRVREALAYAFDFEWGNKNVAFNAYKRTNSYFANSELASSGLPSEGELKLLEPFRKEIPEEVFIKTYEAPKTDGSGRNRDNLRKAAQLLEEAGWRIKNGKLTNAKGEIFTFEIVDSSPLFERWIQPFIRNLERLGILASFRVVDSSQYQNLINDFNYDMITSVFSQSLSPGNEQVNYWGSNRADQKGSHNLIGLKSKAVDTLVEKIIHAKNRENLLTACHALDRVLLWGHYVIPHWNFGGYRLAYWDMFGKPDISPKYGFDIESLWWFDPQKAERINRSQKRNR